MLFRSPDQPTAASGLLYPVNKRTLPYFRVTGSGRPYPSNHRTRASIDVKDCFRFVDVQWLLPPREGVYAASGARFSKTFGWPGEVLQA